jgi:hypothetical protein
MFFSLLETPTELLVWATIMHLVTDWLFQTEWMAIHKTNLRHPAGWVHAGVYTLGMAVVFPPIVAILIGITHLLVDTRAPVRWWLHTIKRMTADGYAYAIVEISVDQIFHVMVIAIAALLLAVN